MQSAQHKRQADLFAANPLNTTNTGPASNASKTLTTLDHGKQSSMHQKYSPDLAVSVGPPYVANVRSFTKPGDRAGVDPRSLAETTYGSKEQLQAPASEITQDGRSHDKRMHELEKVGSGLVQAESNVGSQAASSQEFVHQHSHEMPSYSAAIG